MIFFLFSVKLSLMKNFIIFLMILLFAGFIFFSGWLSFWTSPSSHTVYITKTSGVLDKVTSGSEFYWNWHGIFPTNVSTISFPAQTWIETFRIQGNLPYAEYYSNFLGLEKNLFDYDIRLNLQVAWKPSFLPQMVRKHHLSPEVYDQFLKTTHDITENQLLNWLRGRNGDFEVLQKIEQYTPQQLAKDFIEINRNFNEALELSEIQVQILTKPDLKLYQEISTVINSINSQIIERQTSLVLTKRLINVREAEKRELLAKYGELFEKYPSLVTLLSSANSAQLSSILPSLIPVGPLR